jgi:hypothetical protein
MRAARRLPKSSSSELTRCLPCPATKHTHAWSNSDRPLRPRLACISTVHRCLHLTLLCRIITALFLEIALKILNCTKAVFALHLNSIMTTFIIQIGRVWTCYAALCCYLRLIKHGPSVTWAWIIVCTLSKPCPRPVMD